MALSKNKIKLIHSLEQKKHRKELGAFLAEGHKSVGDLLMAGYAPRLIVSTADWQCPVSLPQDVEHIICTEEELRKASLLLHPQQVLAIFSIPDASSLPTREDMQHQLCIVLDGVQDPGNLGTIIRTADWFGVTHIICSPSTADAYNPKVIQATMGSIARVKVHYTPLVPYLTSMRADGNGTANEAEQCSIPLYGTLLDGNNLYDAQLTSNGFIIMGNEGNGVSPEVRELLTHRLLIPTFPPGRTSAESLNVSIATSIILAEFRRG